MSLVAESTSVGDDSADCGSIGIASCLGVRSGDGWH